MDALGAKRGHLSPVVHRLRTSTRRAARCARVASMCRLKSKIGLSCVWEEYPPTKIFHSPTIDVGDLDGVLMGTHSIQKSCHRCTNDESAPAYGNGLQ